MNVHLFLNMRLKDENKKEAILQASVKLVNEIGFVSASVAKIAKEANVSPATIYIYHKNKEDLLVSIYLEIKRKLSEAMKNNYNPSDPLKEKIRKIWFNGFNYISQHPDYFLFTEQFSHSPYSSLINKEDVENNFQLFINLLNQGIEQKVIKNVDYHILVTFAFYPILILSNQKLCFGFDKTIENLNTAFEFAWQAISS